MGGKGDEQKSGERPDLVRNYRPVAIGSVAAACAMMPKMRPEAVFEPPTFETGFALPEGFHNPPED